MGWTLNVSTSWQTPFEIVVSQVTRRWRAIAIDMPKLWDRIPSYPGQTVTMIERYLERSRDLPIDVHIFDDSIDGRRTKSNYPQDTTSARLYPLMRNLDRWRSLFIEFFYEYQIYETLGEFPSLLALPLVSIHIIRRHRRPIPVPPYHHRTFKGRAPALSHLRLENFVISAYGLPLENITSLSIVNYRDTLKLWDEELLGNFFNNLSSLTHLSICGDFWDSEEGPRNFDTVVLSSLRSLKLESLDVTIFFSYISTPYLELLTWDSIGFYDLNDMPSLPLLHSLTITSCRLEEDERNGLCVMMPALKTLTIDEELARYISLDLLIKSPEILPELCCVHLTLRRVDELHRADRKSSVEKELAQLAQVRSIKDWSLTFSE